MNSLARSSGSKGTGFVQYRPSPAGGVEDARLLNAVDDAFVRLGFGQPIDVRTDRYVKRINFFSASPGEKPTVTIADVGFGASQLLPVIVLTLRSDTPALLLFEQPEIHLHPRSGNLADFFIAASSQTNGSSSRHIAITSSIGSPSSPRIRRTSFAGAHQMLLVRADEDAARIEPARYRQQNASLSICYTIDWG